MTPLKTPEEASPYLGYAPRTLRDLAKKNKIQHTRAGRVIKFSDEDIAAIRASLVVKPTTPTITVRSRRRAAA